MEENSILEKLNTALNILESARLEVIKAETKEKKTSKKKTKKLSEEISKPLNEMGELNRELTVKQCLERYGQPTDDEHVESVNRIITGNGITLEQLDSCLERVKYANDKDPKNDIRKYTYSCLYKVNSKA